MKELIWDLLTFKDWLLAFEEQETTYKKQEIFGESTLPNDAGEFWW